MNRYAITNNGTLQFLGIVLRSYAKTAAESPIGRERALVLSDRIELSLEQGLEYFELGNEGADLEPLNQIITAFESLPTVWILKVRECYVASVARYEIKVNTVWDLFQQAIKKKIQLPAGLLLWAGQAQHGESLHVESTTWIYDLDVRSAE